MAGCLVADSQAQRGGYLRPLRLFSPTPAQVRSCSARSQRTWDGDFRNGSISDGDFRTLGEKAANRAGHLGGCRSALR